MSNQTTPALQNLPWTNQVRTLVDAYRPRPPTQYIVQKLLALPSLSVCYGSPGNLKSMLMADMAMCVATGRAWLEQAPWETKNIQPFKTIQAPVMWLDFDNGASITDNRFEAFGHCYNIPDSAPLYYFSFPSPVLDASRTGQIVDLIELANFYAAKLIVIENLVTISGGRDENQSEIMTIMTNLRLLAEKTKSAVITSTHPRKETGYKSSVGESLRGFSGINGAIDRGLLVIREPNTDLITIKSEKTRGIGIPAFGAMFTYTHKPGVDDLDKARFYGVAVTGAENDQDIENEIITVLTASPGLAQNQLVIEVKKSIKVGDNRIRNIINQMDQRGAIHHTVGKNGAFSYTI